MSQTEIANPMQRPRVDKVVVNISVGKSGEPLQKAMTILERLVDQKPCQRGAKKSVRDWGIRKGEPIACVATLRGENALEFIRRSLDPLGNKLPRSSFDVNGNFSFGVKEHIEIAGVKYDPSLGIFGMDVCVSVNRPGHRVKTRKKEKTHIGHKHLLTPEESIALVKQTLGVEIV